jgi:hypothetical protein
MLAAGVSGPNTDTLAGQIGGLGSSSPFRVAEACAAAEHSDSDSAAQQQHSAERLNIVGCG